MTAKELLGRDFATLSDLIAAHARERGHAVAIIDGDRHTTYAELDAAMDRIAAALSNDGLNEGDRIATLASTSTNHLAAFLGILRAGGVVVPLPVSASGEALARMIADCGARTIFTGATETALVENIPGLHRIALERIDAWAVPDHDRPHPSPPPTAAFNIIYSSGTTGVPKGIVQSHAMRWAHIRRGRIAGYDASAVTMISTPLYSNTTLVSAIPALANGGTLVLMAKFDVAAFLELAQRHRVTHAMLVPVQYSRLMAHPDFEQYDLSSFRMKTCTSAPFPAELKAEVLARWPGGLIEIYGITEGGATAALAAHLFPEKLHTVGRPVDGHAMLIIDDDGNEVLPGEAGEIVGRSPAMMTGYHNQREQTAAAEWIDASGRRYIRTGDIGRFDEEGFLTLLGRKKDVIISGGFNVYPSDIEAILLADEDVADAAVVGAPSERWGEAPVAFVVPRSSALTSADALLTRVNARLGKTQRVASVFLVAELPRNAIGKVLKRDLRESLMSAANQLVTS